MKRILCAALLGALAQGTLAADVGVSISIGDPNFYGRLDIGNFPRPVLMYPQPVIIQPAPRAYAPQPLYLRVPPGHAKNWRKHCGRYNACGRPVYFVQDSWYRDVYAPRYRSRPDYRPGPDYRPAPPPRGERYEERREPRYEERREQYVDDRRDDRRDRREQRQDDRRERGDERGDRGGRGGGRGNEGGGHGHGRHD